MISIRIIAIRFICFFFNDTATTEIYTLSLHDALPILRGERRDARSPSPATLRDPRRPGCSSGDVDPRLGAAGGLRGHPRDRKSTRLNSSHGYISYAVFCLKKKKPLNTNTHNMCSCTER